MGCDSISLQHSYYLLLLALGNEVLAWKPQNAVFYLAQQKKNILNVCDKKLFFLPSLKEFVNIFIYGNVHDLKILVAELLKTFFINYLVINLLHRSWKPMVWDQLPWNQKR